MSSNRVFVSYSHADRPWLLRLQIHLKPLERIGTISLWDDTRLKPGSHWQEEIEQELDHARVAVLLVSADFLASDFITTNELPRLLAAAETRGTLILPVIVSPCRFGQTQSLSRFQAINPPSQPLVRMGRAGREDVFVALADRIEAALQKDVSPSSTRFGSSDSAGQEVSAAFQRLESHFLAPEAEAVSREVTFENIVVRELMSGTIVVLMDGDPVIPAKPLLRRLASRVGVSLLNAHRNPRNTRQLGRALIAKLGSS